MEWLSSVLGGGSAPASGTNTASNKKGDNHTNKGCKTPNCPVPHADGKSTLSTMQYAQPVSGKSSEKSDKEAAVRAAMAARKK